MCSYYKQFEAVVNPKMLENRKRRKFQNLTVMRVKVYINEMKKSQKIHS